MGEVVVESSWVREVVVAEEAQEVQIEWHLQILVQTVSNLDDLRSTAELKMHGSACRRLKSTPPRR